ncbi:MAG: tRNA modification GTPase, partial [Tepidisphaeraceae bacterium]
IPGNVLLAQTVVDAVIARGARPAEPGEFTARAFLNGRLDLAAAEGVALAIHAQHADELQAARQLMAGELSRRLQPILQSVVDTLSLVEAGIDFAEEDISFISPDGLRERLGAILVELDDLTANTARFERLSHEPMFVLVGRPNAGKSTLLNALAGVERAVVSPIAGTTRDALSAHVHLPRGRVTLVDVAGLEPIRETDPVRRSIAEQMQRRAHDVFAQADFVIQVIDAGDAADPIALDRPADLVVRSKADLLPSGSAMFADAGAQNALVLSAKTGAGLAELKARMNDLAFTRSTAGAALALNARHVAAIEEAQRTLRAALAQPHPLAEMIAQDLRHALDAIGQVLGQVTPDDVLGKIFAGFCIGK